MVRGVLRIVSYKWSKFKIISRKKSFFYHSSKNLPNTKKSANFLNIYKFKFILISKYNSSKPIQNYLSSTKYSKALLNLHPLNILQCLTLEFCLNFPIGSL